MNELVAAPAQERHASFDAIARAHLGAWLGRGLFHWPLPRALTRRLLARHFFSESKTHLSLMRPLITGDLMELDPVDILQRLIACAGSWEPDISWYLVNQLAPGDVVVDVGANVGYYTLLAARLVGSEGQVVAFEPMPCAYQQLLRSVEANGFDNVTAHHLAVSSREQTMTLYHGPDHNSGQTSSRIDHTGLSSEVSAMPLGRLLSESEARRVRLIKIDVEGAEPEVIEGLGPRLGSLGAHAELIVELWPDANAIERVFAPLLAHGFRAYELANRYDLDFYDGERLIDRPAVLDVKSGDLARYVADLGGNVDVLFTKRSHEAVSTYPVVRVKELGRATRRLLRTTRRRARGPRP